MITFQPGDIVRLGLLIGAACALGLLGGYLARRTLRPTAGRFEWTTAIWMWIGFWAFGMLISLIADLTTAAGAPFWLKAAMFALLGVMAVGVAQAERFYHRRRRSVPSEPIHQMTSTGADGATSKPGA